MNILRDRRGLLPIAFGFVILLAITTGLMIQQYKTKSPYYANRLKRINAEPYLEAALFEAFNRFRAGTWDVDAWAAGTPPADPVIIVRGTPVTINVTDEIVGGVNRKKVSATLDYDQLSLL